LKTADELQQAWQALNARFFDGRLPSIAIVWSPRLTASAGLFVSRGGPRAVDADPGRRLIRLSLPLLQHQAGAACHRPWREEAYGTLAHEMIHQWQFDILKRHPDHGADFRRKMEAMNHEGLGITVRHDLADALRPWLRYAWRCRDCGRLYERQRRTIRPARHRCGACRGTLQELMADGRRPERQRADSRSPMAEQDRADSRWRRADSKAGNKTRKGLQLSFDFSASSHQP